MTNENALSGYFKVYRSILNWEWFKDQNTLQIFICLMALASFKDGSWQGVEVKRGDVICSVNTLSQKTGLSTKAVRVALNHLKRTNEVAIKGANKYSVVTLVNYDFYQTISEDGANKTANNGADEGQGEGKVRANKGQHRNNVNPVDAVDNVVEITIPPEISVKFDSWLKMRKKIRHPVTEEGIPAAIEKLNKLSNGDYAIQNEILDNAIIGSYQGLFAINGGKKTEQPTAEPKKPVDTFFQDLQDGKFDGEAV